MLFYTLKFPSPYFWESYSKRYFPVMGGSSPLSGGEKERERERERERETDTHLVEGEGACLVGT
jgi:hypothetical protein